MPKLTQQTAIIRGLEANGYQELTATRYVGCRVFRHPDKPTRLLFVGKGGSLRAGQNRTTSMVVSGRFKQEMLAKGGYRARP